MTDCRLLATMLTMLLLTGCADVADSSRSAEGAPSSAAASPSAATQEAAVTPPEDAAPTTADGEGVCNGMYVKAFADAFTDQAERGYSMELSPPPGGVDDPLRLPYFIDVFRRSGHAYGRALMLGNESDHVRGNTISTLSAGGAVLQQTFMQRQVAFTEIRDVVKAACTRFRGMPIWASDSALSRVDRQPPPASSPGESPAAQPAEPLDQVSACEAQMNGLYEDWLRERLTQDEVLARVGFDWGREAMAELMRKRSTAEEARNLFHNDTCMEPGG